jgi:hypothetical protein
MRSLLIFFLLSRCFAGAVLIDQIAVVVEQSIIKDSDIDLDIRVTEFLNSEPLRAGTTEKKNAAAKLINQVFLRNEIRQGGYTRATKQQAQAQLEALIAQRFQTQGAFHAALARYGLDEDTLLKQFQWQLTVLSFIDARFKPAVVVSDAAVDNYYSEHLASLRKEHPKDSADTLRAQVRDVLSGEEVNRLFFSWLDEHRKSAKIDFHESGLA